jgi:hypothetical protein
MEDTMSEREIMGYHAERDENGEPIPIYEEDITPEMEMEFYAAGEPGPEGFTFYHQPDKQEEKASQESIKAESDQPHKT